MNEPGNLQSNALNFFNEVLPEFSFLFTGQANEGPVILRILSPLIVLSQQSAYCTDNMDPTIVRIQPLGWIIEDSRRLFFLLPPLICLLHEELGFQVD